MQFNMPPRAQRIAIGCAGLLLLLLVTLALYSKSNGPVYPDLHSGHQNISPSPYPIIHPQPAHWSPWWTTEQPVPRFAYAQYATNIDYLCNAVINFNLLRRYGAQHDFVLIIPEKWTKGTGAEHKAIENLRKKHPEINLRPFDIISVSRGDATWRDSLTKFHSFGLTEWTRVMAFDSDTLVLNSMDHYFLSPMAPVAVPRAYWLNEKGTNLAKQVLGSHVMLIEPNEKRYHKLIDEGLKTGEFDMEVINRMFKDSAMILPHRRLALLTGEFRTKDHSKYLAPDEDEVWNAMAEVSRSVLVHFSDWPLPKPWKPRTKQQWEAAMPDCPADDVETEDKPRCADRMMWKGFYEDYDLWKGKFCPVLYE